MKPTLLVLAAGMGSRFGGLKQITPVGPSGEWILDYSVHDAVQAGFGKVVFVIREETREAFQVVQDRYGSSIQVDFAFQNLDDLPGDFTAPSGREKPWGTGHAVYAARKAIKEPFAVINADDFYGRNAYDTLAQFLASTNQTGESRYSLIGYQLANTLSETGSVSRGICHINPDGDLDSVEEHTEIESKENGTIEGINGADECLALSPEVLVSLNCWGFPASFMDRLESLFTDFLSLRIEEPKSEFYLPFAVDYLIKSGEVKVSALPCDSTWLGVTHRSDLEPVQKRVATMIDSGEYETPLW